MSELNPTYASPKLAKSEKEVITKTSKNPISNTKPCCELPELSKEERYFFLNHVFAGFLASEYQKQLTPVERAEMAQTYTVMTLELVC